MLWSRSATTNHQGKKVPFGISPKKQKQMNKAAQTSKKHIKHSFQNDFGRRASTLSSQPGWRERIKDTRATLRPTRACRKNARCQVPEVAGRSSRAPRPTQGSAGLRDARSRVAENLQCLGWFNVRNAMDLPLRMPKVVWH